MPTRRLMTAGLYNARDLGGFPTADGKTTKFGVFVRSEAPCELPEEDIRYLRDYGITLSMDFRGTGEVQARPSDLDGPMPYYHKPLFNEAAMGKMGPPPEPGEAGPVEKGRARERSEFSGEAGNEEARTLRGRGPGGPPMPGWGEQYKQMAEEARDWAIEVLTIAAEAEGAVLYHCTTGKDRTGLMSCYLLSIAGVSRADIAADYCVSQVYLEPVFQKMRSGAMRMGPPADGAGGHPPMDDSFFETPASAMLTLIDYLTETYGGVVAYLRSIGVPQAVMDRIREKFTEES